MKSFSFAADGTTPTYSLYEVGIVVRAVCFNDLFYEGQKDKARIATLEAELLAARDLLAAKEKE